MNKKKEAFLILFSGGSITSRGSKYGVKDSDFRLLMTVYPKTFNRMQPYLKFSPRGWIISPKSVLKLRGNHWIKKTYKKIRDNKKTPI